MSYIKPPQPADNEVIYPATDDQPAFTWGDHRQMEAMLQELEDDNPAVAAARARLDKALEDSGILERTELICQYCWEPESKPHDPDCRDYDDPALHVRREAGGYQYFDGDFTLIHTTSVPMTDEEALEYFGLVSTFIIDRDPVYIARREMTGATYKMMPYRYLAESNEYEEIVKR